MTAAWQAGSATWNNQPAYTSSGQTYTNSGYGKSGCSSAADMVWNITGMVQAWATRAAPNYGLRVLAGTETSNSSWRKYRSANYVNGASGVEPRLTVNYNHFPYTPTGLTVSPGNTGYATSTGPTLSAVVNDYDPGSGMRGLFSIYQGSTLKWSGTAPDPTKPYVSNGSRVSIKVPDGTLTDGVTYSVRAYATDTLDNSKAYASATVKVDVTRPTVAIRSSAYTNGDGDWLDTPPGSNVFTLDGASDVASFSVTKDSVAQTVGANATGDATISDWNPSSGAHKLVVTATDRAGNLGAPVEFSFGVGTPGFTDPTQVLRTTSVVPLKVNGQPGATLGSVSWRLAGTSAWTPASDAAVTRSGTAWDHTVTSDATTSSTGSLLWKATEESLPGSSSEKLEAPALLDLRVCLTYGSTNSCTKPRQVELVPSAFGGDFPVADLGPAQAALATGEVALSATDAADSAAGVGRTFTSYDAATVESGVFGPGWAATTLLAGSAEGSGTLIDNRDKDGTFVIEYAAGGSQTFTLTSTEQSTGKQTFGPLDPSGDDTTLTYTPGTPTELPATLVLSTPTGAGHDLTTWEQQAEDPSAGAAPAWVIKAADPQGPENTVMVTATGRRVTWIEQSAPGASGTCTLAAQTEGCRGLRVDYTGTGAATRVSAVTRVIGAPTGTPATVSTLASYDYDSDGALRSVCAPAATTSQDPLCTGYTYTQKAGRTLLASVTPAGQDAWRFGYDTEGRLTEVERDRPSGDPTGGTATWSVDYTLGLATAGLPDMTAAAAAQWGQSVTPTKAYAVYAPHAGATDVKDAQVYYTREDGSVTNTAAYGPGGWQVETSWVDEHGNVVRSLDGHGWATVQDAPATQRPGLAERLSAYTRYNTWGDTDTVGTRVEHEYGPVRDAATLKGGTTGLYRPHTAYLYDDTPGVDPALQAGRPAPTGTDTDPGVGLVVQQTTSAATADMTADFDNQVTRNDYRPLVTGDGDGWKLGAPVKALTQTGPDISTGLGAGDWSIQVTRTDTQGRVIETRQPGGSADANGRGSDAHSFATIYYTAETPPGSDTDCGGRKAWVGLVCKTGPAAQPDTSGDAPAVPTTWTKTYDEDLQATVVEEITAAKVARRTTTDYDALRRPTRTVKQNFADAGVAAETIDTTFGYDPSTGMATTTSSSSKTISTAHDTWGRAVGYTDALGTHSATSYAADGQVKTFDDSAGTYTYTYDTHGALASVDAGGGIGSFNYAWTRAGDLDEVTYPGGLIADRDYDQTGATTGLTYRQGTSELLAFSATLDTDGRTIATTSPASAQQFSYDRLQRLTMVEDTRGGACTTRTYGFDASSNRDRFRSYDPAAADTEGVQACQTGNAAVTKNNNYDSAGRIRNTGYQYDTLGRTLTTPQVDTAPGAQGDLTATYHADDMIATMSQNVDNGTGGAVPSTMDYGLDPAERINTITTTIAGTESKRLRYRFANETDLPVTIEESAGAGTTWTPTRYANLPELGMAASSNGGSASLQLTNLHGDLVSTVPSAPNAPISTYGESDEYGNAAKSISRYGWLGASQRSSDALGGFSLFGARVNNPSTGQFLSADPVQGGGASRYGYPYDPVNVSDSNGQYWWGGARLYKTNRFNPYYSIRIWFNERSLRLYKTISDIQGWALAVLATTAIAIPEPAISKAVALIAGLGALLSVPNSKALGWLISHRLGIGIRLFIAKRGYFAYPRYFGYAYPSSYAYSYGM